MLSNSASAETRCPFAKSSKSIANQNLAVQFEEPPQRVFFWKWFSSMREYLSRIGFSSLRNAWYSYKYQDFNQLFFKNCKPDERISDFRTPVGTQYIIKDPAILQLVLSHFRNQEGGFFCVPENERIFVDGIIKDLYPDEMSKVSDREREVLSTVIFTAESSHVHPLRARIMGFLKQKSVQEYKDQIHQIAGEILDQLTPTEKTTCEPAKLVYEFAITVMGKLFTSYDSTRENYQKIVTALINIANKICDNITKRPSSENEILEYQISLQTIRDLIQENMNATPTPKLVADLRENGLSEFSIKMYLFFFYLAGTETTSAVTHYLLLQLGRDENQHYQDMIRQEGPQSMILKKCITEALRLNPAAFIMGRALRRDVLVTIRDENQSLIWSKFMRKGHYLLNWISGAARDPKLYPDPHAFNPLRYDSIPTQLPWLPFTTGHHTCPGQFLARAEMEALVWEILARHNFRAIPGTGPIETKGTFTLHPDPLGKIKIRFESVKK